MTALNELRCRRETLQTQLDIVSERIDALAPAPHGHLYDWQRGTAAERIELFLERHSLLSWSRAELLEATLLGEHALRRALSILIRAKRIAREGQVRYQAVRP